MRAARTLLLGFATQRSAACAATLLVPVSRSWRIHMRVFESSCSSIRPIYTQDPPPKLNSTPAINTQFCNAYE